jgi:DNA polymerase III delta subunit
MIYLITGDNSPLVDSEKQTILLKYPHASFVKMSSKLGISDVHMHIVRGDLFNPVKGFIFEDPLWVKKSTDNFDLLWDCINQCSDNKWPIIFLIKTIDKRTVFYKKIKKYNPIEVECAMFKDWESDKVVVWLTHFYSSKKLNFEPNVLMMLIQALGHDIGILQQEIDRLAVSILPRQIIKKSDILDGVGSAVGGYHQLSKAFKSGNVKQIVTLIDQLLRLKEDAHKIMTQCLIQLNQLLPLILANGTAPDTIAKAMGKHPFFIKKQLEMLEKNTIKQHYPLWLIRLAAADRQIKQGGLNARQALIMFCHQCASPAPVKTMPIHF